MLLVYAVTSMVLWVSPLLRILHVESAAVVATVAFFTAGFSSLRAFGENEQNPQVGRVLGWQEGALLVPWSLLTVTLVWTPNCGYGEGILFFVLFPGISVIFAVMLAYALAMAKKRKGAVWFCLVGLGLLVLPPFYDLGLHPQFYVYNHVFGGVLGPLYDEELALRPGLFAFRGLTLLWAGLCYCVGRMLQLRRQQGEQAWAAFRQWKVRAVVVTLGIGATYVLAAPLGINTPAGQLRRALGEHYQTEHFDLYYQVGTLTADQVRRIGAVQEYHYARLAALLDLEVDERVQTYLYPDPDTKAKLTGARYTSVAPVWLSAPQVHVLHSAFDEVFPHELAHVFSRAFGLPLLRASFLVGLVEGFAVATEPPGPLPSPHEQVAVAAAERARRGGHERVRLAEDVARRLSPLAFWTGRGAVSYTMLGSFIRYLMDAYGAEPFKRVYAKGDFEAVYGKSVLELAEEWQGYVLRQPVVARSTAALVRRRFAVPSLFEKRCPHFVPVYRRAYERGVEELAARDTTQALRSFEAALAERPAYVPALGAWARIKLARRESAVVADRLEHTEMAPASPALALVLGDASALQGRVDAARAHYRRALAGLPLYAREGRSLAALRLLIADRADVLAVLTSGAPAEEQSARLAPLARSSPAVSLVRAYVLLKAEQPLEAVALLTSMGSPVFDALSRDLGDLLARQRAVWLAEGLYRSGALEEAEQMALQAAAAFRSVGDLNGAAEMIAYARQLRWEREGEREAPVSYSATSQREVEKGRAIGSFVHGNRLRRAGRFASAFPQTSD